MAVGLSFSICKRGDMAEDHVHYGAQRIWTIHPSDGGNLDSRRANFFRDFDPNSTSYNMEFPLNMAKKHMGN